MTSSSLNDVDASLDEVGVESLLVVDDELHAVKVAVLSTTTPSARANLFIFRCLSMRCMECSGGEFGNQGSGAVTRNVVIPIAAPPSMTSRVD